MKKYMLMGLLCLAAMTVKAQIVKILDSETQEPIQSATLASEEPIASTITNAQGQADVSEFASASAIYIQALGYAPRTLSYDSLQYLEFTVYMKRQNFNLNEVVVSATRWRQMSSNVPAKVVTVSPEAVALQNPQTAADLLSVSGKVFIQKSQQGGGSPMMRGFATNRLVYTVDGVRMNTAIFRGGNIQNVINLDPFAIENTEVLFGPGSVMYGSDAIGGVMAFQTLQPKLAKHQETLVSGKAISRYASANNERTVHADVNIGQKKWALVSSFTSWQFDHLRQGQNGPDDYLKPYHIQRIDSQDVLVEQDDKLLQIPSAYSQTNMMHKLRFKPNDHWNLEYGYHYSQTSPYGRYDRHNRMRNGVPRYAEWRYGPQKWSMHHLEVQHHRNGGFYDELNVRMALQSFEESRMSRSMHQPMRSRQEEAVRAYSVNADFLKILSRKHSMFYGVEGVVNQVESRGDVENINTGAIVEGPSRYPQATWASVAAYVQHEWKWHKHFTLLSGIRYNQFAMNADFSQNQDYYPLPFATAQINRGALTGSVGATFRPTSKWVLKGQIGTAFRAPNVDDIGKVFDSEPGAVTIPNPNLNAEYAYSADLSAARVIGEKVKIDATAFYTYLDNALVRRNFHLNGMDSIEYQGELSQVQALQNAARAQVFGLQAGLELHFGHGFRFASDINFQEGREELDDGSLSPSRHAAPWFGVSRLTYRHKGLELQCYMQYQGERSHANLAVSERSKDEIYAHDGNGNTYAPAWYTINLKMRYQINKTFTITGGVENMTDQRYRPYSSGISGAGRNVLLAATAHF